MNEMAVVVILAHVYPSAPVQHSLTQKIESVMLDPLL